MMAYRRRIQIIFQNPVRVAQPALHHRPDPDGADAHPPIGKDERERVDLPFQLLARVGLASSRSTSTRTNSRGPAPAHRDRALPHDEARRADLRRIGLGARRVGAGAGAEPAAGPAGRIRLSYIFISHDLAVVKYISGQVMVMNEGEIVEIADSDEIYLNPQQEYTRKLLSSIPKGWQLAAELA
jgi:peptide/nickel transport system ATP-binding protein